LRDRAIYVDVWDGASLLQIGTARVPLSALLRRATEKVHAASATTRVWSVRAFCSGTVVLAV
jgi:transcriptional regulator